MAQKRVWNDDRQAVTKGDTSLVKIDGKFYRKVITVTYVEVDSNTFDDKLEYAKQALQFAREQRERQNDEIERLRLELEAERKYVQTVKAQMKWLERSEREIQTGGTVDLEKRRESFRTKKQ